MVTLPWPPLFCSSPSPPRLTKPGFLHPLDADGRQSVLNPYFRFRGDLILNDRILVKAYANEHGIDFRTITRARKSPHRFYVLRSILARLEREPYIVAHDIYSFAVLRRDSYRGTLTIDFTWLRGTARALSGWEETVILPYAELMGFIRASAQEGGPETWRALSLDVSKWRPQLVFEAKETLHNVLENATIRHKLFRCLNSQFRWPDSDQICFYNDFAPYSFFFRETRRGQQGICGGLILHGREDMSKAYYSVHT